MLDKWRSVLVLAAVAMCVLAGSAAAQETRLLADPGAPGEWKTSPWNKAPGEAAASPEFPPSLVTPPGAKRGSLALAIDWPGGKEFHFCAVEPVAPQPPIPCKVLWASLWVKGTGTDHFIELHFADATGKDVKVGLGSMNFTDWRKLRVKIPDTFAQPLAVKSLTFHDWGLPQPDKVTLYATRLEVVVDPVQKLAGVSTDGPVVTVQSPASWGMVTGDGPVPLTVNLQSWQPGKKEFEVRLRMVDWQGKETAAPPQRVTIEGSARVAFDVPVKAYGPLACTVELWEVGGAKPVVSVRRNLVRAVPLPRLSLAERAKSYIGVNAHQGSPWEALSRSGVHWARDYSWGWLKMGEGGASANGADFRAIWKAGDDVGVTIMPITMATFRNKENTAFIEDAAAITAAFARLGKLFPEIPYWELDNEADYGFPTKRLALANYSVLIRSAAAGLRQAGKGRVIPNGTVGIQYGDTVELMKSAVRDDFAAANYHYYTGEAPPETAAEDVNVGGEGRRQSITFLDQLRRINRAAHAAGKEAWLTEIGWDVQFGHAVGERLQAIYLARAYLLSRWCGTDKVFWFFDRDVPGAKGIFGSCGLFDNDNAARPSAAALAAVSLHTALAEVGGFVDLGDDRWCILFRKPAGGWVATAWSVKGEYPLPAELSAAKGFDLFGNARQDLKITPEVAYFHLDALPPAWEAQRTAEWLSPTILTLPIGAGAIAEAASPAPLAWLDLPQGVSGSAWAAGEGRKTSTLSCTAAVAPGMYAVRVQADGGTWKRAWPVTLRIVPAVEIKAAPYAAGKPSTVELRLAGEVDQEVTLVAAKDAARFDPATATLRPGQTLKVACTPAAESRGPVAASLALKSGVRQEFVIRPLEVGVPKVKGITLDGKVEEWPEAAKLGRCLLASAPDFQPETWLGWSAEGLYVAARVPVKNLGAGRPQEFWDATALELFVDTSGAATSGAAKTVHQFWLTPVKEDAGWRLYVGEWKRSDAISATIFDDKRCRTAIRVTDTEVVLEALIPAEALGGAAPAAGGTWRAAVAIQRVVVGVRAAAAWPVAKDDGILTGPAAWGILRMTDEGQRP